MALFRIKDTYKNDASLGVLEKVCANLLRLMDALGLAAKSAQGETATLLRPLDEHLHAVVHGLTALLGLSEAKKNNLQAALETRGCNHDYDQQVSGHRGHDGKHLFVRSRGLPFPCLRT